MTVQLCETSAVMARCERPCWCSSTILARSKTVSFFFCLCQQQILTEWLLDKKNDMKCKILKILWFWWGVYMYCMHTQHQWNHRLQYQMSPMQPDGGAGDTKMGGGGWQYLNFSLCYKSFSFLVPDTLYFNTSITFACWLVRPRSSSATGKQDRMESGLSKTIK